MQKILIALGLLCVSTIALAQRPSGGPTVVMPWADADVRLAMEDLGWDFRSTFGLPEHLCYALPPKKHWPGGEWQNPDVRDLAVKGGAIRFKPRDDGKCYAADAKQK